MITWLLASSLLSCVGVLLYLGFRNRFRSPKQNRRWLHAILAASVLVPLLTAWLFPIQSRLPEGPSHGVASSVQEFCHCQNPDPQDHLMFHANQTYDFFHQQAVVLQTGFWIIAGGLGLFMLIKILYLTLLPRLKGAEKRTFAGQTWYEVPAGKRIPAGAFRLFRKYLLWNPQLNQLPQKAQDAIRWHELSHIQQGNTYEQILLCLLHCFWFFNPAFYFFRAELNRLGEFQADDLAVEKTGSVREYALLLVEMQTRNGLFAMNGFASSQLKKRIQRLVEPGKPQRRVWPFAALLILLLPTTGFGTQQVVEEEVMDFRVYEYMCEQNEESGKEDFCRRCTYETVARTVSVNSAD